MIPYICKYCNQSTLEVDYDYLTNYDRSNLGVRHEEEDRIDRLKEHLNLRADDSFHFCQCDVFIHTPPKSDIESIFKIINGLDQDIFGFVMAWNGKEFVSNN